MNRDRRYLDYVQDSRDAIEIAAEFIADMTYDQFAEDDKTEFVVIRAFEMIGEAAKEIPDTVRQRYTAIPWREMAHMRDKLIHH